MSITGVSAYSQMESWRAKQKAFTNSVIGSNSSAGSADFSSAFSGLSASYYAGMANVAALAAVTRVQTQIKANNGISESGESAAKSAGNAILRQLGYAGYSANTATSDGTYKAPTNSATGKGYVKSSAASINNLNALNLFA
jgi:hypothetical protein